MNHDSHATIKWIIGLVFAAMLNVVLITLSINNNAKAVTLKDIKAVAESAARQSYENSTAIKVFQEQMQFVIKGQDEIKAELKELNGMHRK